MAKGLLSRDTFDSWGNPVTVQDVPYYPSQTYLQKNWAPERIPLESIQALAKAQAIAHARGVLSPTLANSFLPNSLVEGYTGGPATITLDKGVGDDYEESIGAPMRTVGRAERTAPQFGADLLGYEGPIVQDMLRKMGVYSAPTPTYDKVAKKWSGDYPNDADVVYHPGIGYVPNQPFNADANARVAAIILAMKAKLYGEDKAIQRWNGIGALSENHARKVAEMQAMLGHPSNAVLRQAYAEALAYAKAHPEVPEGPMQNTNGMVRPDYIPPPPPFEQQGPSMAHQLMLNPPVRGALSINPLWNAASSAYWDR